MNTQSRKMNSIRNVLFSMGHQFLMIALNFISRTIFIKTLGAEYLGINGLFSNILTVLSLADLGLQSAMAYSFYKPISENNTKKLSALVHYYKKMYTYIAIAMAVIGIAILPFLNIIINIDTLIPNIELYYIMFLVDFICSYLFVYKITIIEADQNKYIISKYSMFLAAIKTILQIIILLCFKNYFIYLLIQLLYTLIRNIILSRRAEKMYPFIKEKQELETEEKRSIFSNIKSAFLYKTSGVLLNGTDNIIISCMIGTVSVGYYSNYNMIVSAISTFISTIFSSLYASIGNLVSTESSNKKQEVFALLLILSFAIAGITTTCFYILFNDFIQLWLGNEFVFSIDIVIAIIMNYYLFCISNPIWSFREATGLFKQTKYIMLITAIINIILSILLGKYLGLFGIIIASVISRLVTIFWYEPRIIYKNILKKPVHTYFIKQAGNVLITILCIVITSFAVQWFTEINVITFSIKLLLSILIPSTIYLMLLFRNKNVQNLLKNQRRKLK